VQRAKRRRGLAILRGDRRRPAPARRPAPPTPHLVFWSQLDLRRGARPELDGWVEDRARTWLAFTLPSILAQRHETFEYWLVCDPAGREQTEPLAGCRVLSLGGRLGALVAARSGAASWHGVSSDAGETDATRAALRAAGLRDEGVVTWDAHRRSQEAPYDVVLHDLGDLKLRAATLRHALTATDPAGFLLLDDAHERRYASELDRRLTRMCVDVYPEGEQLTRDASGRHARLLGRVLGPAA